MDSNSLILMLYILCDMQETTLMDLKVELSKGDYRMRLEFERKYKKVIQSINSIKKDLNRMSEEDKIKFGETTDGVYEIISNVVNISKGFPDKLEEINNLITSNFKRDEN